jgi:endogenous inhibitor of DNA gyrase (YacG/DUF329 family)
MSMAAAIADSKCKRCQTPYHWEKSSSNLKMTYCSILCEIGDLGFSIDSIFYLERMEKKTQEQQNDNENS